jgi:thiol-disulfide isomerase/thioredoxin
MTPKNAAVLLAAVTLGVAAAVAPAVARAEMLTCTPHYDWCVEVDGKYPQDARFFTTDGRGKSLIDIPSQSISYLIDMPAKKAIVIPRANLKEGTQLKVDDAVPNNTPSFAVAVFGPEIRFDTSSAKVRVLRVLEREPVIGQIGFDALVADRMEYREGMKQYSPDSVAMEALKNFKKPVEIEAYFATWCPHCLAYMPKLLRVLQDAHNPNIKVTLYGVPKAFGTEKGPWSEKNIQNIPAIFVRYEGKDVTRLGAQDGAVPEVELAGILNVLK